MNRKRISTDTPWEDLVGYSGALRVGPHVYVSGTTATDSEGRVVGKGDPCAQAAQAIQNIERALEAAGAGLEHVVRTRIYVTDTDAWEEVGRAHGEAFGEVRPAATMVEVRRLVDPAMLVEIEADAILEEGHSRGNSGAPPSVRGGDGPAAAGREIAMRHEPLVLCESVMSRIRASPAPAYPP